jgi:hypothetical protein
MSSPTTYLHVKTETARKTGRHAEGCLTYVVLRDAEEVYLALTANDGGGYFSREAVPFSAVERCVEGLAANQPILAKAFKSAFVSRSANNPGFLAAVLRQEGLLVPASEAAHQLRLAGDWPAWRQAMLASPGEPYELPGATPAKAPQAAVGITNAEEPTRPAGKGRKPRKAPKAERQRPSGEETDHASHP